MNRLLRKLAGIVGVGLSWAPLWFALFLVTGIVIGIVDPDSINQGEDPLTISGIGFMVGLISGAVFGLILSIAEDRKSVLDLRLGRVAIWGVIGAATWPLISPVDNRMIYFVGPFGALCALIVVTIARRAKRDPAPTSLLSRIGRLVARPLQAACG